MERERNYLSSPKESTIGRRDFLSLNFTNRQKDQSPTIKQNEKWKEFEPISLNGSTIKFFGVEQSKWSYVPWYMGNKILEEADWSEIILLEYLPSEIEYNLETFASEWLVKPYKHKLNAMKFYKHLYDHILTKYKDTGKMIGCINPEGNLYMLWDTSLATIDGWNFGKTLTESILPNKRMTRNEFLKRAKRIAPIAYLIGRDSIEGLIVKLILAPKLLNNKNYKLEDTLWADTTNYLNVRTAENLVRLTEMLQKEEESRRILYIGNINRLNVIRSYVTEGHNLERKLKTPVHTLHSLFAKSDDIKIYYL